MLNRAPLQLPPLQVMLDDLGRPPAPALARVLGVRAATVRRWVTRDEAPRPVLLSLFWLTRWGLSLLEAECVNRAALMHSYAASLAAELQRTRALVARLERLGDFGAANSPLWGAGALGHGVDVPLDALERALDRDQPAVDGQRLGGVRDQATG